MKKLVLVIACVSMMQGDIWGNSIRFYNHLDRQFKCKYTTEYLGTGLYWVRRSNEVTLGWEEAPGSYRLDANAAEGVVEVVCSIDEPGYVGTQVINPGNLADTVIEILPPTWDSNNKKDWFWLRETNKGAESGKAVQITKAAPKFEQVWYQGMGFNQTAVGFGKTSKVKVSVQNSTNHEMKCTYSYQTGFGPYASTLASQEFKVGGPGNPTMFEESLPDGARFASITCTLPDGTKKTIYNYDQDRVAQQFDFIYSEPAGYVFPGASTQSPSASPSASPTSQALPH